MLRIVSSLVGVMMLCLNLHAAKAKTLHRFSRSQKANHRLVIAEHSGNVFVCGETLRADRFRPPDRILGPGSDDTGTSDIFVIKFSPDGTLITSVLIGGSGHDWPLGMVVNPSGELVVHGVTSSPDFPTTNAVHPVVTGTQRAFIFALDSSSKDLRFATFLTNKINAIAADHEGGIVLAGVQTVCPGGIPCHPDIVLTKLAADGDLVFSRTFGGTYEESVADLAVDTTGQIYVIGTTISEDFPTVNPIQEFNANEPWFQGFLVKMAPDAQTIMFSTFLGADGCNEPLRVAVDGVGKMYVVGRTTSSNFGPDPPPAPFDELWRGFALVLEENNTVRYARTFSLAGDDAVSQVWYENDGGMIIGGRMGSAESFESSIFLAELTPNGTVKDLDPGSPFRKDADVRSLSVSAGGDLYVARRSRFGGGSYLQKVSIVPSAGPRLQVVSPEHNSRKHLHERITLTAGVIGFREGIAAVTFYDGGNPVGTATRFPYEIEWRSRRVGTHQFRAVAMANDGQVLRSPTIIVEVLPPARLLVIKPVILR